MVGGVGHPRHSPRIPRLDLDHRTDAGGPATDPSADYRDHFEALTGLSLREGAFSGEIDIRLGEGGGQDPKIWHDFSRTACGELPQDRTGRRFARDWIDHHRRVEELLKQPRDRLETRF
jgi:hypothetical protein